MFEGFDGADPLNQEDGNRLSIEGMLNLNKKTSLIEDEEEKSKGGEKKEDDELMRFFSMAGEEEKKEERREQEEAKGSDCLQCSLLSLFKRYSSEDVHLITPNDV